MDSIRFRFRIFLLMLLAVTVAGTVGFMLLEKRSLIDAFYFSIVTVATVGYGDVTPATTMGKWLAMVLIITGVGIFLGVVANATDMMLNRREQQARLEKLNMVIGAFFSEVGTELLEVFSQANPNIDAIRAHFLVAESWTPEHFAKARADIGKKDYEIDIDRLDLDALFEQLVKKREFMLRLLENPVLLEHESFTDILWAVFHLTEELAHRDNRNALPDADRAHLTGDVKRAYSLLIAQWLAYMQHLKSKYPYLLSLALRTNPFDRDASPIVT